MRHGRAARRPGAWSRPAADEERRIAVAGFAIGEARAVERGDAAAGSLDDGLAGSSVPLAGFAVARIMIGRAFGNQTEFRGAAHGPMDRAGHGREIRFDAPRRAV